MPKFTAYLNITTTNAAILTVTIGGHDTHADAREAAAEFIKFNEPIVVNAAVTVTQDGPTMDPITTAIIDALYDRLGDTYPKDEITDAVLEDESFIFSFLDEAEDVLTDVMDERRREA